MAGTQGERKEKEESDGQNEKQMLGGEGGLVRERERAREVNCEWRKNGSVDDETGTCRSACATHVFTIDVTCPYTRRDWEGVGGGKAVHFP